MGSTIVGKTQIDFFLESPESLTGEKIKINLKIRPNNNSKKLCFTLNGGACPRGSEYPGCQRLFMRGFRFRSSLKK